jgi:hypothetical protein
MLQRDMKDAWDPDGVGRESCADWLDNRRSGDYFDDME